MTFRSGFFEVDVPKAEQITSSCRQAGWRVFLLADDSGTNKGFFASIKHSLPLDPPLQSGRSWDALADSLWEGLYRLPDEKI